MKSIRITFLFVFWGITFSSLANNLTITENWRQISSTVTLMHKSWADKYSERDGRIKLKYSMVVVKVEKNFAKAATKLSLGKEVETFLKKEDNEIWFLVPYDIHNLYLTCGEDCEKVLIFSGKMESGSVYVVNVDYEEDNIITYPVVFHLSPLDAKLTIEDSVYSYTKQPGMFLVNLQEGIYNYSIESENYHTLESVLLIDGKEEEYLIEHVLKPKFGTLIINGDLAIGGKVYLDERLIGSIPITMERFPSGKYKIKVLKAHYKPYEAEIRVKDGETLTHTIVLKNEKSAYERYSSYSDKIIETFLLGQFAYSPMPQMAYGALLGQTYAGVGWYVNGTSNFQTCKSELTSDENGLVDGVMPFYTGRTKSTVFSVHGGLVLDFLDLAHVPNNRFNTFGLFLGAGYGSRKMYWEQYDRSWVNFASRSYTGVSANAGLVGSIYGLTFSVGANTIQFKYWELEAGIGFMF